MKTSHTHTFEQTYPAYANPTLDHLRATDFARLDAAKEIYLDYTGGGLYGDSQLTAHVDIMRSAAFGNPHSDNPTSLRSTEFMEEARAAVLAFFNAPVSEYCIIFTANASAALKLVGEAYPFNSDGRFLQLMDNHNSVSGIREFARRAHVPMRLIKSQRAGLHVRTADVSKALADHTDAPHLFAYPAQSNFSGVQHSLDWIELAHNQGWDVLLDAAAFAPTNKLDLNIYKPDFVALSFYKMFGWPTGVGCLIAKKSALAKLQRPWFAGGTIWALSVQGDWHIMAPEHESFEDGTVNYLNMPAVTIGLDYLKRAGVEAIHARTMCITGWLLEQMLRLRHPSGQSLIEIYGPVTAKGRGPTIAFNFLDPDGRIIDERAVSREAKKWHISLRTGCFCNPGAGEITFDLSPTKLAAAKGEGERQSFDHYLSYLGLQSGGAIRISFGLASTIGDAKVFLAFAKSFITTHPDTLHLPSRGHC